MNRRRGRRGIDSYAQSLRSKLRPDESILTSLRPDDSILASLRPDDCILASLRALASAGSKSKPATVSSAGVRALAEDDPASTDPAAWRRGTGCAADRNRLQDGDRAIPGGNGQWSSAAFGGGGRGRRGRRRRVESAAAVGRNGGSGVEMLPAWQLVVRGKEDQNLVLPKNKE